MRTNNQKQVSKGLAEVCEMLAKYHKTTPKQKKDLLKYADVFRKLSGDFKNKNKLKEVKNMGKRLTEQEKEDREVKRIVAKIIKLEKVHPQGLVERACYRYKNANLDRRRAEKEIAEHEKKLAEAKRRLK